MAAQRSIAFLSDFGHRDPFVGICHAVIARHDRSIKVIDLTHGVEPQNVRAGALAIEDAHAYLPDDCVVLAVVDPGVGSERHAVAVECVDGKFYVGPNNGLLGHGVAKSGGVVGAVELSESEWRLDPVSATFHGRDIFSPVAARLAAGSPLAEAGAPFDVAQLATLPSPRARMENGVLFAEVIDVDAYGNVRLAAHASDLPVDLHPNFVTTPIGTVPLIKQRAYALGAEGEVALIVDSTQRLSLAINCGDASELLALESGDEVKILFE